MYTDRSRSMILNLLASLTVVSGILTIGTTLLSLIHIKHARIVIADAHFTVLAGLSLIYLAFLLRRGKYNAWLISLPVYGFLIVRNFHHFVFDVDLTVRFILLAFFNLAVPIIALSALLAGRRHFTVRSSLLNFTQAIQRALVVLLIAFLYGLIGFQLLDHQDFHQEVSLPQAAHYTLDQFGLTTNDQPFTYTKRSVVFVDSLAAISVMSIFYVVISLFSPIRFRLTHSQHDYEEARDILKKHSTTSEDFFKLWPRDKAYFFNASRSAMIAYRVQNGVALAVGDPSGPKTELSEIVQDFKEHCYVNGWLPAFIHAEERLHPTYRRLGFEIQKIGEEPIVETAHFCANVVQNKYFRHIKNKFEKAGFKIEILTPPHSKITLDKLSQISDDWLKVPGRVERGFMMGYFSLAYIQMCEVAVVKDSKNEIQAFLNRLPVLNSNEANFDFLRYSKDSPGNVNDYLMLSFIEHLYSCGVQRLNMGLSPLSGLDSSNVEDRGFIDNLLNLVYSAAGRFYSFQGLRRFKDKYEPRWEGRFIVYSGGTTGFGKTMNALIRAMSR